MDNTTLVNSTTIEEITGSDSVNRGTFTFTKEDDDNISLRLDGSNKITSNVKYQNFYTFILIMSKDLIQLEDCSIIQQKINYLVFGVIKLEVFG